jgi:FkbM family methyltransferase
MQAAIAVTVAASAAQGLAAAAASAAAATARGAQQQRRRRRRRASPPLLLLLLLFVTITAIPLTPAFAAWSSSDVDEKTAHALTAGVQERLVAQERVIAELRTSLEELPARLEHALARRFAASAAASARALVVDPIQAAVLNRTLSGADSFLAARMVRFEGQELLMLAPRNDEYVGGAIMRTGQPYDGGLLRTLLSLIRPGSTVVDAGGNIGSYTAHLAAQAGPSGRVYAFEPQRKMFMVLCANAAVNSLLNVFPQNVALSFAPGEITMSGKVPDGSSAGVDIEQAERAHSPINYGGMSMGVGGERALARTLDWYNLTDVSLIKVDVQGAEPLMFWGARQTIRRCMPAVAFEDTPDEFRISESMRVALGIPEEVMAFDFKAFFRSLNYTSFRVTQSDRLYLPPGHPASDRVRREAAMWGGGGIASDEEDGGEAQRPLPTLKPSSLLSGKGKQQPKKQQQQQQQQVGKKTKKKEEDDGEGKKKGGGGGGSGETQAATTTKPKPK